MGKFIAGKTIKYMIRSGSSIKGARVNVLGLTFKEDCPDLRNSHVIDVIRELQDYGCEVTVHDPLADPQEAAHEYGARLVAWDQLPVTADALVCAVAHRAMPPQVVGLPPPHGRRYRRQGQHYRRIGPPPLAVIIIH
jgi:UDP-N-acetyl-D-galactosamine dehydrogenase